MRELLMITGRAIYEELRKDTHNGKTISSYDHSIGAQRQCQI
jgi:hypothetical protein